MAVLGSGVLMLSASADGFQKDLKRAGGSVVDFNKRVQAVPEIGEKISASFGRIAQVGSVFTLMSNDASLLEKTIAGVNTGVGAMVVGMQLAVKVTSGMKAALIGTGIGALVVGLGWVVSQLSSARAEEAKEREEWQKFLDRVETRATRSPLPEPRRGGAWDLVSLEEVRRDREARERRAADLAAREEAMRPAAELGLESGRFVEGLESVARAAGRSREEMALLDLETRRAALALNPLIAGSDTLVVITRNLARARAAMHTIDMTREVERLRTPLESARVEIERMVALSRGGGDFETLRRGLNGLMGIAPGLDSTAERIDTILASFRALVVERDRIARIAALPVGEWLFGIPGGIRVLPGRDGGFVPVGDPRAIVPPPAPDIRPDFRGVIDRFVEMAGDIAGPATAFRERMASIDRMAAGAREAFFRGGMVGPPVDFRRFERGAARAFLDAERAMGSERSAPQAFLEGSAEALSAINAARRNAVSSDPMRRVEATLERLERIEEAERRELEGIGRALAVIRRV